MDNSLHTIPLHRFKYVGSNCPILLHKFVYVFKVCIDIHDIDMPLKKVDVIQMINKIKVNKNLDKTLDNRISLIKNDKDYFTYHIDYIGKFKQDKILDNIYTNEINILSNKIVFYIKYKDDINKLKNDFILENRHNEYNYINVEQIKNNKQLTHQERSQIFIDKTSISTDKFMKYINLNNIGIKKYNNKLLTIIANDLINKIDANRNMNKEINIKNIDIVKEVYTGVGRNVIELIEKHNSNPYFIDTISSSNIHLIDTYMDVENIKNHLIDKYNHNKYVDIYSSNNINKTDEKIYFIDTAYKEIYKIKNKIKNIDRYNCYDIFTVNNINLGKKIALARIQRNNFKNIFLRRTFANMNHLNEDKYWLEKTYVDANKNKTNKLIKKDFKNIDYSDISKFTDKIYTNINKNNNIRLSQDVFREMSYQCSNRLISKTYVNTNKLDTLFIMRNKIKNKINKINSNLLLDQKYKNKILKHDPIFIKQTYGSIELQDFNLYSKIAIHDINKTFVEHSLNTIFNNIDIIKTKKPIKETHKEIYKIKDIKAILVVQKQIDKSKDSKGLNKDNAQSIDKINVKKMLKRDSVQSINIVKDMLKYFEIKRDWWIIEHDGLTDKLIIPNIDYPYENESTMGIIKHPISSIEQVNYQDTEYGIKEIEVSIKIMQQMLNIIFMMWHTVNDYYKTLTPIEAIEKTIYVFYYWLNIDKVKEEMINKNSREDYLRVYRWFRWEAEKVWIKERDDVLNTGIKSIGMLLAEIIEYMKNHHYNIVPLTNKDNIVIVNNMLEVFKLKIPDYYRITDKKKGKRKYVINSNEDKKLKKFIKIKI